MDPQSIQAAKDQFALSQNPPLDSCKNTCCKCSVCTCGNKCGCNVPVEDKDSERNESCDPCVDFKQKMMLEKEKALKGSYCSK